MMVRAGLTSGMQRLLAPLRRNVAAKLFAAGFAFLLWFFVNAGKRETQVFQFPIELRNAPAGTMRVDADRVDTVAVKLNGPGALLASLDSRRSPIMVDLSEVEAGRETRVRIRDEMVHVPRGVRVLDIEPSRVTVRLEAVKQTTVPVKVTRNGEPAAGYTIARVTVEPATVTVSGPATALEGLKAIETEPVDAGGLSASVERSVGLVRSDPPVTLTPEQVRVRLEVEPIQASRLFRDLVVGVRNVDRPFKLSPERVNLTVRGPERVVQGLELGSESVYVDAASLGPGEHKVAVEVALPGGVAVAKREPAALSLRIFEKKDGTGR